MNLRNGLFIFLCVSVVSIRVVVFMLLVPVGTEKIAGEQPYSGKYTHVEKKMMQSEKENIVQSASETKNNTKDVSGVLKDAVYRLSSDGSISVDVLLAALDDNDSK